MEEAVWSRRLAPGCPSLGEESQAAAQPIEGELGCLLGTLPGCRGLRMAARQHRGPRVATRVSSRCRRPRVATQLCQREIL